MKPTRITRWAATAVAGAALAFTPLALAGSASAAPAVTASTHVINNLDSGGNGNWSSDNFVRTLTVTPGATANSYTATVRDSGHWSGIVGGFTPNQSGANAGTKITHSVSGTFSGGASYSFTASTAPSAANVAAALDDNFTAQTGKNTTSLWYEQAFSAATTFGGTGILNTWSWTYKEASPACHQQWVDSAVNGDGQGATDGNITGASCTPPAPHYAVQAHGFVQSEQSHKYLAVLNGKLVQENLSDAGQFAMVINTTTNATGLEVLTSLGHLTGKFVQVPDSGQAFVVNHFAVTSKHGAVYYNTQTASPSSHVLNNAQFSLANGNRQIGWLRGAGSSNENYTSPGQ